LDFSRTIRVAVGAVRLQHKHTRFLAATNETMAVWVTVVLHSLEIRGRAHDKKKKVPSNAPAGLTVHFTAAVAAATRRSELGRSGHGLAEVTGWLWHR
jgi:hypothetical protein